MTKHEVELARFALGEMRKLHKQHSLKDNKFQSDDEMTPAVMHDVLDMLIEVTEFLMDQVDLDLREL